MSNLFTSIRFVMALLTVLAIAGKPFIPPKTLILHPSENTEASHYGPPTIEGQSGTIWLDKSSNYLRCEAPISSNSLPCGIAFAWKDVRDRACVQRVRYPQCSSSIMDPDGNGWGTENEKTCINVLAGTNRSASGHALCDSESSDPDGDGWGFENEQSCIVIEDAKQNNTAPSCASAGSDPDGDGWGWENERSCVVDKPEKASSCDALASLSSVDATGYDGLVVKVHYEGRSPYLNLILTGTDPELFAQGKKPKPMSAHLSTEALRAGPVFVGLKQFSTQEWWILQQNPPRELAAPGFSHVTQVAVDINDQGVHRLRVDEIKLVGERIDRETYLLVIAVLWACYLLFEASLRYYRLRTTYQHEQQLLEGLVGGARQLEKQKVLLEHRSQVDPLTQVFNRNGLAQRLHHQYGALLLPAGTGLFVFDIDHFKALNDTYGHDAGDEVLQDFAALITSSVRTEDAFARWGGEEFLLVVDNLPQDKLMVIAEKLRQRVAQHPFLQDKQLKVTVSIGVALSKRGETFEALFKRADNALYEAKATRNTVAYAH